MSKLRACRRCGKAIVYRVRRSTWMHVSPGADHPPLPSKGT